MLWLKIILSSLLLGYLLWGLDLSHVLVILHGMDWRLFVAACLCLLVAQVLSALRWAWLARGLGLVVRLRRKISLYFLGMFLSLFLPSIIGGDVARGWLLAKGKEDAAWSAGVSVLLERINGMLGLMLLVSFCLFFLDVPMLWLVLWNSGLLLLLLVLCATPWWWPRVMQSAWALKRAKKSTGDALAGKTTGWQALRVNTPAFYQAWWRSLPLSLCFQALVVQAHVFLGLAVGLELSWFVYGFVVCVVALATVIPVSFNGFGIREGGYIALISWFGGASEAAAAMAALWVLVLLIVSLPGGIILWRMGGSKSFQIKK